MISNYRHEYKTALRMDKRQRFISGRTYELSQFCGFFLSPLNMYLKLKFLDYAVFVLGYLRGRYLREILTFFVGSIMLYLIFPSLRMILDEKYAWGLL